VCASVPLRPPALLQHESWLEYVNSTYKATQERESKPLGGQKPSAMDSSSFDNPSMYGSSESDNSMSDQMARYLAMQMTGGLPSQALIHDDDDDDLLELDGDRLGNFRASGVYSSTYDDMDSDDEVGDGRMVREPGRLSQQAPSFAVPDVSVSLTRRRASWAGRAGVRVRAAEQLCRRGHELCQL